MSEPEPGRRSPHSLEQLDARMRAARSRQAAGEPARDEKDAGQSELGMAWRIGLELVSALIVGVGIGYLLDRWLGTKPWFLVAFFVLGSAAGILNVFRATKGLGGTVGYQRARSPRREEPQARLSRRGDDPQARVARREDDDEDDGT
jgi:ATP synthase protein I